MSDRRLNCRRLQGVAVENPRKRISLLGFITINKRDMNMYRKGGPPTVVGLPFFASIMHNM